MNCKMIRKGDIYMNYVDLCAAMGETPKSGKSKIAHLSDMSRYFRFEKDKNKFIIEEVYAEPISKDMLPTANSKYMKFLELIIVNMLLERGDAEIVESKQALLKMFSLATDRLLYTNAKEIAEECNTTTVQVQHYKGRANTKMRQALESTLKSLDRRSIVFYRNYITYKDLDTNEYTDADDDMMSKIYSARYETLKEFDFGHMGHVYLSGKEREFYSRFQEIARHKLNIADVRFLVKIKGTEYTAKAGFANIANELLADNKIKLNDTIVVALDNQAAKIYEDRDECFIDAYESEDEMKQRLKEKRKARMDSLDDCEVGKIDRTSMPPELNDKYLEIQRQLNLYILKGIKPDPNQNYMDVE